MEEKTFDKVRQLKTSAEKRENLVNKNIKKRILKSVKVINANKYSKKVINILRKIYN